MITYSVLLVAGSSLTDRLPAAVMGRLSEVSLQSTAASVGDGVGVLPPSLVSSSAPSCSRALVGKRGKGETANDDERAHDQSWWCLNDYFMRCAAQSVELSGKYWLCWQEQRQSSFCVSAHRYNSSSPFRMLQVKYAIASRHAVAINIGFRS